MKHNDKKWRHNGVWGSYTNLHKIPSRQPRDLKLTGMIAYIQFYKI